MPEGQEEAKRRGVELLALPTDEAIAVVNRGDLLTNAVLDVTY